MPALRYLYWGCFINNSDNSDTLKRKIAEFSAGKIKRLLD